MASYIEEFGEWVKSVLERNRINPRQAEIRTRISFGTIQSMVKGKVPRPDMIIRFASSYHEDVPSALRLADYEDFAVLWESGAAPVPEMEIRERDEDADGRDPVLVGAINDLKGMSREDLQLAAGILRTVREQRLGLTPHEHAARIPDDD